MSDATLNLRDVVTSLRADGTLGEADEVRLMAELEKLKTRPVPGRVYVRILLGLGAWIAAPNVLWFFAPLFGFADEDTAMIVTGLILLVGSTVLRRYSEHIFAVQLALAVGLAGVGLVLGGIVIESHDIMPAAVTSVFLTAVLYPLFPDSVFRFLTVIVSVVMLCVWLLAEVEFPDGLHVLVLIEWIGMLAVFTHSRTPPSLMALGYGLATSLAITLGLMLALHDVPMVWFPSGIMLALGLIYVYGWLAGGKAGLIKEPMIIACVLTIAMGLLGSPGVLAAIAFMVLGYGRRDRALIALGCVFLPGFLVGSYYSLGSTLLVKAAIMGGTGAVLLLARAALGTRPWAKGAGA